MYPLISIIFGELKLRFDTKFRFDLFEMIWEYVIKSHIIFDFFETNPIIFVLVLIPKWEYQLQSTTASHYY